MDKEIDINMQGKGIVETPYAKLWIKENILYGVFANQLDIDLNMAKKIVDDRIAFSQGISYPCLFDMRGMHTSTKEAGDYFANEGTNLVKAVALIIGTPLTNMMGNIFFKICKQKVPLKLFPNEKKAIDWLKLYL